MWDGTEAVIYVDGARVADQKLEGFEQLATSELPLVVGAPVDPKARTKVFLVGLSTFDARELNIDALRVASPCSVAWDSMQGDERVRRCATCALDVFDASYLNADEVRGLLASRLPGQRLCMKLYRRTDGTLMTSDCPVGARRRRLRTLAAIAAGLGALAG